MLGDYGTHRRGIDGTGGATDVQHKGFILEPTTRTRILAV